MIEVGPTAGSVVDDGAPVSDGVGMVDGVVIDGGGVSAVLVGRTDGEMVTVPVAEPCGSGGLVWPGSVSTVPLGVSSACASTDAGFVASARPCTIVAEAGAAADPNTAAAIACLGARPSSSIRKSATNAPVMTGRTARSAPRVVRVVRAGPVMFAPWVALGRS